VVIIPWLEVLICLSNPNLLAGADSGKKSSPLTGQKYLPEISGFCLIGFFLVYSGQVFSYLCSGPILSIVQKLVSTTKNLGSFSNYYIDK